MMYAIIGPDLKVHYRRPEGHDMLEEARRTPGYRVVPVAEESKVATRDPLYAVEASHEAQ